jgi:RNA polymerase sigma-70 factor (ECF subfamily)
VDHTQHADETLLRLIAQHDPNALSALYERHAQTIYNVAMHIVRDATAADEILQDTFWQVWQKAADFSNTGSGAAWLYRIARNKSLDQLRRRKARPEAIATSQLLDSHAALATEPRPVEQATEQAWQQQQVRHALASLPDEQRLCLELVYFEGLSHRQIAEQTQSPIGTVKTRVRMGLEKLARLLRPSETTMEAASDEQR